MTIFYNLNGQSVILDSMVFVLYMIIKIIQFSVILKKA